MATSAPVYPAALPIPVDLFVSKKHPGLDGDLGFADSTGNIVFRVNHVSSSSSKSSACQKVLHVSSSSSKSSACQRVLLDSSGNPLISMFLDDNGSWQGFKGSDNREKDLIFRVRRTLKKLTRTELEVFLAGEISSESNPDFKVKGFPCQRSCTIYAGDSIVAQTSLMYKLHQVYARRSKFRLTIFPGSVDPSLIASLVVIFLYGQ